VTDAARPGRVGHRPTLVERCSTGAAPRLNTRIPPRRPRCGVSRTDSARQARSWDKVGPCCCSLTVRAQVGC